MEQFLQEGDQAGQERWTADDLEKQCKKRCVHIFLSILSYYFEGTDLPLYLLCHIPKAFRLLILTSNLQSYERRKSRRFY